MFGCDEVSAVVAAMNKEKKYMFTFAAHDGETTDKL